MNYSKTLELIDQEEDLDKYNIPENISINEQFNLVVKRFNNMRE